MDQENLPQMIKWVLYYPKTGEFWVWIIGERTQVFVDWSRLKNIKFRWMNKKIKSTSRAGKFWAAAKRDPLKLVQCPADRANMWVLEF